MKSKHPRISVIIPARNEQKLLPLCLNSLTNQHASYRFELIVVDSNSTDDTQKIAASFGARVINEPKRGKVYGFLAGAKNASGEILCFTEADCIVPPRWVETIGRYFDTHPKVAAISGMYSFHSSSPFYNRLAKIGHFVSHAIYCRLYGNASLRGSNFAIRKSAYQKIGGFSDAFYELYDVDLGKRARAAGAVHHVPAMEIQTSDRRIRGRIFRYLCEAIPTVIRTTLFNQPLRQHTYQNIR